MIGGVIGGVTGASARARALSLSAPSIVRKCSSAFFWRSPHFERWPSRILTCSSYKSCEATRRFHSCALCSADGSRRGRQVLASLRLILSHSSHPFTKRTILPPFYPILHTHPTSHQSQPPLPKQSPPCLFAHTHPLSRSIHSSHMPRPMLPTYSPRDFGFLYTDVLDARAHDASRPEQCGAHSRAVRSRRTAEGPRACAVAPRGGPPRSGARQKARHAGQGRQRARATARATRPVRAYATHLAEPGIEANGSSRVLARLRCMHRSITFGFVTKLEWHKIHVAKATVL